MLYVKWISRATVLIICACLTVILFAGRISTFERGFDCQDGSIQKPFKPNTVSTKVLLAMCIGCPFLYSVIIEFWRVVVMPLTNQSQFVIGDEKRYRSKLTNHGTSGKKTIIADDNDINDEIGSTSTAKDNKNRTVSAIIAKVKAHPHYPAVSHAFYCAYRLTLDYLYGFMIHVTLMHLMKSGFGRLRPHFIDICNVDVATDVDCHKNDGWIHPQDFQCRDVPHRTVQLARQSFPSGHSASVVYCLCFLLFYNARRRLVLGDHVIMGLVKWVVLIGWIIFTVVTMVTRVTDHWHHTSDVLGGLALGAAVAGALFWKPSRFQPERFVTETD